LSTGLGIAIAGVAFAAAVVLAAWIVVRTLKDKPVVPERQEAEEKPQGDIAELLEIDTSRFDEVEKAEVEWMREVFQKEHPSTVELAEAQKRLDYYRRLSESRASEP